jgi:hypothetical protein
VRRDGLYVVSSQPADADADDGSARHQVHTLRHVQAMAALRAGSVMLGDAALARTAALMLRRLHDLYAGRGGAGGSGSVDGKGAFHFGMELLPAAAAAAGATAGAGAVELRPIRGLTSEQALLLLYLEPGDVPSSVIARTAAGVLALETPAGLKSGKLLRELEVPPVAAAAEAGAGSKPAPGAAAAAAQTQGLPRPGYVISPLEQVAILAAAAKHARHEVLLALRRSDAAQLRAPGAPAAGDGDASAAQPRAHPVPVPAPRAEPPSEGASEEEGAAAAAAPAEADGALDARITHAITTLVRLPAAPQLPAALSSLDATTDAATADGAVEGAGRADAAATDGHASDAGAPAFAELDAGIHPYGVTYTLLRHVVEACLRVHPALERLQREAATRHWAMQLWAAQAAAAAGTQLAGPARDASLAEGLQGLHAWTFPELLTPLAASEAERVISEPAQAPPVCPGWGQGPAAAAAESLAERRGRGNGSSTPYLPCSAEVALVEAGVLFGSGNGASAGAGVETGGSAAANATLTRVRVHRGALPIRGEAAEARAARIPQLVLSYPPAGQGLSVYRPRLSISPTGRVLQLPAVGSGTMAGAAEDAAAGLATMQAGAGSSGARPGGLARAAALLNDQVAKLAKKTGRGAGAAPAAAAASGPAYVGYEHVLLDLPLQAAQPPHPPDRGEARPEPQAPPAPAPAGRLQRAGAAVQAATKRLRDAASGVNQLRRSVLHGRPQKPHLTLRGAGEPTDVGTVVAARFFRRLAAAASAGAAARLLSEAVVAAGADAASLVAAERQQAMRMLDLAAQAGGLTSSVDDVLTALVAPGRHAAAISRLGGRRRPAATPHVDDGRDSIAEEAPFVQQFAWIDEQSRSAAARALSAVAGAASDTPVAPEAVPAAAAAAARPVLGGNGESLSAEQRMLAAAAAEIAAAEAAEAGQPSSLGGDVAARAGQGEGAPRTGDLSLYQAADLAYVEGLTSRDVKGKPEGRPNGELLQPAPILPAPESAAPASGGDDGDVVAGLGVDTAGGRGSAVEAQPNALPPPPDPLDGDIDEVEARRIVRQRQREAEIEEVLAAAEVAEEGAGHGTQPEQAKLPSVPRGQTPGLARSLQVDVAALHARICLGAGKELAGPGEPWWYSSCCASSRSHAATAGLRRGLGDLVVAGHGLVAKDELPTFTCPTAAPRSSSGFQAHPKGAPLPCSFINDDFCDCAGGDDEPATSACATGLFKCRSGALVVQAGELRPADRKPLDSAVSASALQARAPAELAAYGFIPASKVGDGIKDCAAGEDEESSTR